MRIDELRLALLEGGVTYVPYFALAARPYDVASAFQSSLSELAPRYRVSVEHKEDENKEPTHLRVTQQGVAEDEWKLEFGVKSCIHRAKALPYVDVKKHTEAINAVLAIWVELAHLEDSGLDWAGQHIAVLLEFKNAIIADALHGMLTSPNADFSGLAVGSQEQGGFGNFELDASWLSDAGSENPEVVNRIRLLARMKNFAAALDFRSDVSTLEDVTGMQSECLRFFAESMFPRFIVPFTENPDFDPTSRTTVATNER